MFTPEQYAEARSAVEAFNTKHGGELLLVANQPAEQVTLAELQALSRDEPGEYIGARAFARIKGREPTHGEKVLLGHRLAHLGVSRRKVGQHVLWSLDATFAARAT